MKKISLLISFFLLTGVLYAQAVVDSIAPTAIDSTYQVSADTINTILTDSTSQASIDTMATTDKSNVVYTSSDNFNLTYSVDNVHIKPKFMNYGANEFENWISWNVEYTDAMRKAKIQGKIIVSFIISETGSVRDVVLEQGIHSTLDQQVVNAIYNAPNWVPGRDKEFNPVNVKIYSITTVAGGGAMAVNNDKQGRRGMDDFADYNTIAMKPTFNNGNLSTFTDWVKNNIKYPKQGVKKGVKESITVEFLLDSNGILRGLDVISGINKPTDALLVQTILNSPKWSRPGRDAVGEIKPTVVEATIELDAIVMTKREQKEEEKEINIRKKEEKQDTKEHAAYEKELEKEKAWDAKEEEKYKRELAKEEARLKKEEERAKKEEEKQKNRIKKAPKKEEVEEW